MSIRARIVVAVALHEIDNAPDTKPGSKCYKKDILKLVNTIIANTKGDGEKSGEDFWVKAEKLYYTALIGYIWYEAPEDENGVCHAPGAYPSTVTAWQTAGEGGTGEATLPLRCLAAATPL